MLGGRDQHRATEVGMRVRELVQVGRELCFVVERLMLMTS
jgi:hypothetical protein